MNQIEAATNEVIEVLRNRKVPIGISNRHVHLSEQDYNTLFPNEPISVAKPLGQPGHYAANQYVDIIGPKCSLERVRILGPLRSYSQLEISLTNARELGLKGVIRQSGDLKSTPGVTIRSHSGEITLKEGVIVAKRHIHMSPLDALIFDLQDNQEVSVGIDSDERKTRFDQVIVRVDPSSVLELHLDTDEANAAGLIGNADFAVIIKDE